jgi:hypothetical protein
VIGAFIDWCWIKSYRWRGFFTQLPDTLLLIEIIDPFGFAINLFGFSMSHMFAPLLRSTSRLINLQQGAAIRISEALCLVATRNAV